MLSPNVCREIKNLHIVTDYCIRGILALVRLDSEVAVEVGAAAHRRQNVCFVYVVDFVASYVVQHTAR
jgi:hypothetical protein